MPLRTDHLGLPRFALDPLELQVVAFPRHPDGVAVVEVPLQQLECDRILQPPLDHALERTGSVDWIVPLGP